MHHPCLQTLTQRLPKPPQNTVWLDLSELAGCGMFACAARQPHALPQSARPTLAWDFTGTRIPVTQT